MPKCAICGTNALFVKYNRCQACFDSWPDKNNPEPEACKKRTNPYVEKDNQRGSFAVKLPSGWLSSRTGQSVDLPSATFFNWSKTADEFAAKYKGKTVQMIPAEDKPTPTKKGRASMKDTILNLIAIKAVCKDMHYGATGQQFYGLHLLADRIAEPISGFIDSIKEVCFLGNELDAPSSAEIHADLPGSIPTFTNPQTTLETLKELLKLAEYRIEEITALPSITQGELNLLGEVAQHLKLSRGLVHRTLTESTEKTE